MKPRAMLIADDPISISSIRRALRATCAFDVVDGYADAAAGCSTTMIEYEPDVVVVDQLADREVALTRIAEVRTALPDAKIVLLQDRMDPAWLGTATVAGVDCSLLRSLPADTIGLLVREVVAGHIYHAFAATEAAPVTTRESAFAALTERELDILRRVADGAPNSRIAAQLWITEQTVKFHLSNVYRKLGVTNRTQASHYAHVNGLLTRSRSRSRIAA
jgi:DNA-binding NarL/FixJ family response regulator